MNQNKLIDGMVSCIHTLDRSRFKGICVASDLMRDGAWAARQEAKAKFHPVYWIITENATAIGYDKSLTVDYYTKETPSTCIGAFIWNGKNWAEYPLDCQA